MSAKKSVRLGQNLGVYLGVVGALGTVVVRAAAPLEAATLTGVEGKVEVLLPGTSDAKGTSVQFEGERYVQSFPKVGSSVPSGSVIRTYPSSRVKLVYANGDTFLVAPATYFKVQMGKAPGIEMKFGKIRGLIEKSGPRTGLSIRTASATMGVRGTDFFVADGGKYGMEVSVLRGKVEVAQAGKTAKTEKPLEIGQGQSGAVEEGKSEIRKTSQQELQAIQKSSSVKTEVTGLSAVQKAKIEGLEKKALETTLKDIKEHDPKLYAQMDLKSAQSLDQLNSQVVQELKKTAPVLPEKRKPRLSELEDLEGDVYQRYYKE